MTGMTGMMQDYPLTLQHVLWRVEKLFGRKEIVTKREDGVHRYTYGDLAPRVHRLAHALRRLGVGRGDRVATLAWNNYRHMELYYAVPCRPTTTIDVKTGHLACYRLSCLTGPAFSAIRGSTGPVTGSLMQGTAPIRPRLALVMRSLVPPRASNDASRALFARRRTRHLHFGRGRGWPRHVC